MSAGESGLPASAEALWGADAPCESIRLDPARSSVTTARRWLRLMLGGVVADDAIDDATLVASELITNSVEHTSSEEITLTVCIDARGLVIEVHDQGPGLPTAWPVPGFRGRSRGLMMVGKLSTSVTSRIESKGVAVVEAVIPLTNGAGGDA